jgi:hypothetical protein
MAIVDVKSDTQNQRQNTNNASTVVLYTTAGQVFLWRGDGILLGSEIESPLHEQQ